MENEGVTFGHLRGRKVETNYTPKFFVNSVYLWGTEPENTTKDW